MPVPLAIVGASARAAAASAVRAGFQPVTADLFADLDLRRIASTTRIAPYPEGFLDWLRTIEPPAWMYTGALENHPELVDQMAWLAPLWGNPGDVLAEVRSPWLLAETLRDAGFLFPETRSSPDGLPRDGSWLVKTYRGASGSGVRAFVGWVESHETHQSDTGSVGLAELDQPYVFQRRIAGVPCAAVFVADGEAATLLGLTRQLVGEEWGARPFQYAGSIGPYPVAEATLAVIARIGSLLAERFTLTGLFGVDFIIAGDQVWTLEVNPRYTASVEIVERATGVTAIAAHAAVCGGFRLELNTQSAIPAITHGKAILFAKRPVVISDLFAQRALDESATAPWPALADVSPAGTSIATGRPVVTVFAEGNSVDDVERQLRMRVAEVEGRLYAV